MKKFINGFGFEFQVIKLLVFAFGVLIYYHTFAAQTHDVSAAIPKKEEKGYPVIIKAKGQAFWTGKDGVRHEAKDHQVLVEMAKLETLGDGKIELAIDSLRSVHLDENTSIELPSISWETSETPYIYLERGTMRWTSPNEIKVPYVIRLQSPLYEIVAPSGEVVITFTPSEPSCEVKVLKGRMEFFALNSDDSYWIQENHKIKFRGVIEDGSISYDLLLRGKKIPRGQLEKPQAMSPEEVQRFSFEEQRKREALEAKQKEAAKVKQKKKLLEGKICREPLGGYGDCLYLCKTRKQKTTTQNACLALLKRKSQLADCFRYRCNAEGIWSDPFLMSADKGLIFCQNTPVVKICDKSNSP